MRLRTTLTAYRGLDDLASTNLLEGNGRPEDVPVCKCGITNEQDERDLREMLADMAGTYGEPATPEEMEAMIQANEADDRNMIQLIPSESQASRKPIAVAVPETPEQWDNLLTGIARMCRGGALGRLVG